MQELFSPLSRSIVNALQDFPQILNAVLPMQPKHRHLLPQAIEELSTRLTSERGLLQQPYWSAPRFTSAYVWYFLPWNILRLTRLLQSLDLPEPTPMPVKKNGPALPRIFTDMGSGPLSLPMALWLAKPQWRSIPLTIVCTDISPHPLSTGQKIFEAMMGKDSPWRIITRRCHLEATASEIHKTEGIPWLISAANVCNELKGRNDQSTEERLEEIIEKLLSTLQSPDARLLFVEPGTRLGGKTIVSLREAAQNYGLAPLSPCTHTHECPLDDTRTWCHFTFDTQGAPRWLTELSTKANLRKEALSLSYVLFQNPKEEQDFPLTRQARIISAPFRVPQLRGFARYACAPQGLALLGQAEHLPSGALVQISPPTEDSPTDKKSGAFILEHREEIPQRPRENNWGDRDRYSHSNRYERNDRYEPRDRYERNDRYDQRDRSDRRPYAAPDHTRTPRSYGSSDERFSDHPSKRHSPRSEEKKKKVIKPSKKNEKKFWEK